jgi:hypothetical protein
MFGKRRGADAAGGRRARRIFAAAGAVAAAFALGDSLAGESGPTGPMRVRSGTTSLRFEAEILRNLGIAVVDVAQTSAPLRDGALGFALAVPSSSASFDAAGADFEGFDSADLRHAGGFALRTSGGRLSLEGFRLHEANPPHALELRDAEGRRWLVVDKPHATLGPEDLSLANADLLLAPELAAWLDRPDLAGSYIGTLDARLSLEPAQQGAATAAPAGGSCVGDFTQPVDLHTLTVTGMTQGAREPGGRVAVAPSATVRNLGPGDVQWFRAIAPDSPVGPHPFLVLNFYRLSGGVLEQIGRSHVKHAFFAVNSGCACPSGHILYAGCDDLYGVGTNLDRTNLAPRSEVDALAVSWTSLGSHFDAVPVDDFRDHGGDAAHDSFEHRLVVMEPDLLTPGARYFYDAWYVAPNDTNLENSIGHREVAPSLAGSTWGFPTIDSGSTVNGSILNVLVDPQNVQPGQATELLDTGDGRVHLAAVTTSLGSGSFHYEYALMNFDFERQVQSFSLPIGTGQTVSNPGFDDGDADPQNDWTASIANGHITWTAPAGNALDWGTLFNFRIDADAAPVQSAARLTPFQPGGPAEIPVQTLPEPSIGWSVAVALAGLAIKKGQCPAARPESVDHSSWILAASEKEHSVKWPAHGPARGQALRVAKGE